MSAAPSARLPELTCCRLGGLSAARALLTEQEPGGQVVLGPKPQPQCALHRGGRAPRLSELFYRDANPLWTLPS